MLIQFIPLIFGVPLIGFWFWMLVDLTNHPYLPKETKNNWFIKFLLLNFIGALWYYFVEYRPRHI